MSDHLKRQALSALILLALAAPLQAQTNAPSPAAAATNPVRVADLLDLPIVDESKSAMGRVRGVVRTDDGKVQLLLPLGGLFGFGERLVPIPIENVALSMNRSRCSRNACPSRPAASSHSGWASFMSSESAAPALSAWKMLELPASRASALT